MSSHRTDDPLSGDGVPFETVHEDELGYEPRQVDAFLARARSAYEGGAGLNVEEVRRVRFATVGGGYATDQVDDMLDRLEAALATTERDRWTAQRGAADWERHVDEARAELLPRLERAPGERFRRPTREDATAYDVDAVDELTDRLHRTLVHPEQAEVDSDDVRKATFGQARGKDGYDEAQVDAFLDAAVDVLLMLE